ncbi:MAG: hypothetical protein HS117_26285 [Verrucomicrobiaceae bacterium]|nr:hypothetical protein [Verrucomicrobiaceae bacterium]
MHARHQPSPRGPGLPAFSRVRRPARRPYTENEMVALLRWVLVRECWRHTPDIATLSRRAGIPYEVPRRITAASRCMKTFPRRITSS